MRFLVDAQLPRRLARYLTSAGHDAVHTSDLPAGNRTDDRTIIELADAQHRIVVSKDRDFRDSHAVSGAPQRLLIVATGNITNTALLALFERHLGTIEAAFAETALVELRAETMVVHRSEPPNLSQ